MFGLGLVRCEIAKEGMLSLRRVISHNDGLTESTVLRPSSHPLECARTLVCVNTWLFVFPVFDFGYVCTDVAQCVGKDTPPGISISW